MGLKLFIFFICVGFSNVIFAQIEVKKPKYEIAVENYQKSRIGKSCDFLTSKDIWKNGIKNRFEFDNRPIFFFCGMEHCVACDLQTPYFIKLVNKFKEKIRFVYLSYNSYELSCKHMNRIGYPNFNNDIEILSLDEKEIVSNNLTFGYPTKFITDSSGIIKYMEVATSKSKEEIYQNWIVQLNHIL